MNIPEFSIAQLRSDETLRTEQFPIVKARNFLAHAGVTSLPRVATDAMSWFGERAQQNHQEAGDTLRIVDGVRNSAATLIGAGKDEIALLGPTALGLNMISDGIQWQSGDEVVFYRDDYPANVYPWRKLKKQGVKPVAMVTETQGVITWEVLEPYLNERTKLVSLATANFLTGFRVDIDEIGKKLHQRGILFCVDGIQTLGAFPFSVEHVDFLSADSHKWMLGPMGAGIVYIDRDKFQVCEPTLLGSWNVVSPNFIAQEEIDYYEGARRYEPGSLNLPGIFAMGASLDMLLKVGIDEVAAAILDLREYLVEAMNDAGWELYFKELPAAGDGWKSGIITFRVPEGKERELVKALEDATISVSVRHDRAGEAFMRASPHFYNTRKELDGLVEVCRSL
jgi:selenocysteine lyase/cysteine desulfurase